MRVGPSLWAPGGGVTGEEGPPAAGPGAARVQSKAGRRSIEWPQVVWDQKGFQQELKQRFYFFSFSFAITNGIVFRKMSPPTHTFGPFVLKIT